MLRANPSLILNRPDVVISAQLLPLCLCCRGAGAGEEPPGRISPLCVAPMGGGRVGGGGAGGQVLLDWPPR